MEVPFDYILINIMINLMERNIAPRISKDNLEKIIIKFIKSYYNDREVLDIINNFDIDYELNEFYSKYLDYFDIDDDTIFLNDSDISSNSQER